ncbi:hypothetical protein HK101_009666, partial [Irineochytrium annulatum]
GEKDGEVVRGLATATVSLVESWGWDDLDRKGDRTLELARIVETEVGEFNRKVFTFPLPATLLPTLRFKPLDVSHRLVVKIAAPLLHPLPPTTTADTSSSPPDNTTTIAPAPTSLSITSDVPYPVAGFTRDDCDDLFAHADNLPPSVLNQIPPEAIGRRLQDMEYMQAVGLPPLKLGPRLKESFSNLGVVDHGGIGESGAGNLEAARENGKEPEKGKDGKEEKAKFWSPFGSAFKVSRQIHHNPQK